MLRVKTLGGFQLTWNDRPVSLGKQAGNNMVKLFMLLMLHKESGIARAELIRDLFYQPDAESDTGANLRITVYRLRQSLKKGGISCPEGEDYILIEQGIYRWNPQIPVSVDVLEFENLVLRAIDSSTSEESFRLGEQAFELYTGEFLPNLSSEEWVNGRQLQLMKTYRSLFMNQYHILESKGEYQQAYDLAKRGASLYPYEEYQVYMMDCLLAMKRYTEAMQLYDDTAAVYFREMGMEPSEEMRKRFDQMSNHIQVSQTTLEGIRQRLKEDVNAEHGPYYCALPSFIDNFRFVQRLLTRTGQSAYIEVVTLENLQNLPLEPGEKRTEEVARILEECISDKIRKGDMVTRYNGVTFLLLLMCTSEEGCRVVEDRIAQSFRSQCPFKKVRIGFRAFPVLDIDEIGSQDRGSRKGVVRLCIDGSGEVDIRGTAYTECQKEPIRFASFAQMLSGLNSYFDRVGYPQAENQLHSINQDTPPIYNIVGIQPVVSWEEMCKHKGAALTADLQVNHRRRSSWQGSIRLADQKEQYTFISELQLLKILEKGLKMK